MGSVNSPLPPVVISLDMLCHMVMAASGLSQLDIKSSRGYPNREAKNSEKSSR
jgi:hypothetical protein